MVMLEATAERSLRIRAPIDQVLAAVLQVEVTGLFWPGVRAITPLGDATYRWELEPRRTLGIEFTAQYTSRYENNGRDQVTFDTVSGNVKSRGRWRLAASGAHTETVLQITSEVEVPVPRLLKKPAELFARKEVQEGIDAQLQALRKHLER
jgi:uncharacterized membrane protein